jgi:hypothetical protein
MQFELPRNENSYVLTHDILRGPFRTRTADPRHRRERTIGSSVDQETHDVFSAIVKLFDRTPAAVLNQLIDSFILLARPYVIDLVETRNGAGAHESRMFSDERYRQIFEWESRYSASTRGGNENDAR